MQSLMRSTCALLCTGSSYHDYFRSFKAALGVVTTSEFAYSTFASSETLAPKSMALFGEVAGWNRADWTSSDDRVRGGKSESHLAVSGSDAVFYGNLDIETLGGAGFASQRTTGDDRSWNLSDYDGIILNIAHADEKKYTFIIKDEIRPPTSDGREQSTISYEYDFEVPVTSLEEPAELFISWNDMKATYRGKEKQDAPELNTQNIRRFSIMMRSFFGTQKGNFSLRINSVKASKKPKERIVTEPKI